MSNKQFQKMGLPGLAFTSIGCGLGVAIVAYMGNVIGIAGKAAILPIVVGLLLGAAMAAPYYLLSKKAVIRGGQYSITLEGLGPVAAGLSVYSTILGTLFYATYPTSILSYISSVAPGVAPYTKILALAIIVIVYFLFANGIKVFEKAQTFMTVLMLICLTIFVILGCINIIGNGINPFDWSQDVRFNTVGVSGTMSAIPLVIGMLYGYVWVVFYGPMAEKPTRNIPKAILIGGAVMCVFWVLITIVASSVLPVDQVANQPLTLVAQELMGPVGAALFVLGGPLMTITTTYLSGLNSPTVSIAQAASEGWFPKFFAKKNSKGISANALCVTLGISVVVILLDIPVYTLLNMVTLFTSIMTFMVSIAFYRIPDKNPDVFTVAKDKTVFRVVSILSAMVNVYTFYLSVRNLTTTVVIIGVVLMVVLGVFCYFWNKSGKIHTERNLELTVDE